MERSRENILATWRSAAIAGAVAFVGGMLAWIWNIATDEIRMNTAAISELRVLHARQDAELAAIHRWRDRARGDGERADGSVHR